MPKKQEATKPERAEWKNVQAFFNFLHEVNEKTWQASTENFIRVIGGSEEQATNRAQWFSKPAIYNNDGSSQVKAETILNFSNLFKRTIKNLSESQDAASALAPIFFLMISLMPKELSWNIPKLLHMAERSNRKKDSEFKNLIQPIFEKISWGILDEIAIEFTFLLPILHQQHKIGWCEECGKLFLRQRRSQRWCSKKCRDRVYNRPSRIAKASQRKI
ncbi:hypothetical protein LM602_06710 [Candidatus Acetothermia bacterium]|jgi:hypothetical protein|nr:hypothetical protein [Candidatus Acetothermia bacterium]MCI2432225.1 hypothetical protein [Candidatus Acetothermia bacterium]MCI2436128.1 hypothetical protein [Candidatus Acetothermia bacterium]